MSRPRAVERYEYTAAEFTVIGPIVSKSGDDEAFQPECRPVIQANKWMDKQVQLGWVLDTWAPLSPECLQVVMRRPL